MLLNEPTGATHPHPPELRRVERRALAYAALVWLATAGLALAGVDFLNDHFDRLSRARQILVYGDRPFADFRDPGYFLTLYASAAAQAVTGGSLLGDAVLVAAAIATAGTLTFWLAAAGSGSVAIGLVAALLTWYVPPRYYDFDKVFFYTAGVFVCWRYLDVPTRGRLAAAGLLTACAALFRYDNGLYLLAACITAIVLRHRATSSLWADVGLYAAVVAAALAPALIFVHFTAGVAEAARQMATYAAREGQRSHLFSLPPLAFDQASVAYLMIAGTPLLALASVGLQRWRHASLRVRDQKVLAAAVLCACVCTFVLRDPIAARIGAAVPVAVIIAAAVVGQWWPRGDGVPATRASGKSKKVAAAAVMVCTLMLLIAFPQQGLRLARAPFSAARRLPVVVAQLAASPPLPVFFPDDAALGGIAAYLRTCTTADARVLVTWFAPEVFFFGERGFAGGMAVILGEHWSSDADQRRTIEQMRSQRVPLAIVQTASADAFRSTFPLIAAYLDAEYRVAGETSFDDRRVGADGYRVLVRRDVPDLAVENGSGLPCPASRR